MPKSFTSFISESELLLEYDENKTWNAHGKKIVHHILNNTEGDNHSTLQDVRTDFRTAAQTGDDGHHELAKQLVMDHLAHADPTPNKKYVQHVARIYGAGGVSRFEDLHSRMKPALGKFDELAKRKVLPAEHRDIGQIKSLSQLEDLVDAHSDKMSGKQEDKAHHEKMKGESTITDHPEFTHIVPHTEAAASHFGKGTRWCTTSEGGEEHGMDSMFKHYNEQGPLQIMIPKKPSYAGEKYQYHFGSGQMMNEKDEPVGYNVGPDGQVSHQHGNRHDGGISETPLAIAKHVQNYEHETNKIGNTSAALDHPEKSLRHNYLGSKATSSELMKFAKNPDASELDIEHMSGNKNYSAKHAAAVLDNNKNLYAKNVAMPLHPNWTYEEHHDILDKALDNHGAVARNALQKYHGFATAVHIKKAADRAVKEDDPELAGHVVRSASATPEDRERIFHETSSGAFVSAQSPKTPSHLLLKAAQSQHEGTAAAVMYNQAATPEMGKAVINNHHHGAARLAVDKFGAEHPDLLHDAMNHPYENVRASAASHQHAPHSVLDKALEDKSERVRIAAVNNRNASSSHLDKALSDTSSDVRRHTVGHPNFQLHHIDNIVNNEKDYSVIARLFTSAYSTNKIQAHHVDKLLDSDVPAIASIAADHPSASNEAIHKALDHPHPSVNLRASQNRNLTPEHIDKALNNPNLTVQYKAARHRNASKENIEKALSTGIKKIHRGVLTNPNIDQHLDHDRLAHETSKYHDMTEENMSFKNFIAESTLLLEYDQEKTWKNHGEKALNHVMNNEEDVDHEVVKDIRSSKKSPSKARAKLMSHFEETDPTPNKKYVQHVARIYGHGGVNRFEDLHSRMKPALEKFHDLSTRKVIPADHRDLGRVKTLDGIEDLVEKHGDQKSGKQVAAGEHSAMKGQATITDHDKFTQITPHTSDAANHFGKGTRWCTTGSNGAQMFNSYRKNGPLHILIPKSPSYAGEKYQYHFASGQFMNEKDSPAADRGNHDYGLQRTMIGNPKASTHKDISDWVNKYEIDAHSAIHTREGLSHQEPKVAKSALSHAHDITSDDLTNAMKGGAAVDALKHPKVEDKHVKMAFDHTDPNVLAAAIENHPDKINKDQITRAMSLGGKAALAGIKHPLVEPSHIDQALKKGGEAGTIAVQNPALSREHLSTALSSEDFTIRKSALKNPSVNEDDLHAAVKKDAGTAVAALEHPKITSEHVASAMNHMDASVKVAALNHPKVTDDIKDRALESTNPRTRAFMIRNGGDGMAEKGINDPHELVRWASVYAKDGHKVLDKAVHDIHPDVRMAAVMHPDAPASVLEKGAFDNDATVNAAARGHKKALHRGEHAFVSPKYPARFEEEPRTNANYTHVPGNPLSDLKFDAMKTYVKNHNKTASSKVRLTSKGRAGVGNPWNKTEEGKRHMKQGSIPLKHASRVDVYVSRNDDWQKVVHDKSPEHIHKFHPRMEDNATFDALCDKAKEVGVQLSILTEVFSRGLNEWDEGSNKTAEQYAFNRLNSFVSGGLARKLDEDLLNEINSKTLNNYIRKAKLVVDNTPEDSKVHKKSKKGIERAERKLNEVSAALVGKYVDKAQKSVKSLEDGPYSTKADTKAFKRKMFLTFAQHSKLHKEESNDVDISGPELIERQMLDPTKLLAVHRRDTKSTKVIQRHNEKSKHMRDVHRTEMVLHRSFIKRHDNDTHFTDRSRHQLTDRWRNQRLRRIADIRKAKNVHEGAEYIDARQKLHDAHSEAARMHAGMERDPELRRLDLHRSKKHAHASRVLEILKSKIAKKKK